MIYLSLNNSSLFPFIDSKPVLFNFFALNTLKCKGFEGNNKLQIGLNPTVESNISNPTSFRYNDANFVLDASTNGSSISTTINWKGNPETYTIRPQQGVNINADGITKWTNTYTNGTHNHTVATSNSYDCIITSYSNKIRFSELEKPKILNVLYQHITPLKEKNIFYIDLPSLSFGSYFINVRNDTF